MNHYCNIYSGRVPRIKGVLTCKKLVRGIMWKKRFGYGSILRRSTLLSPGIIMYMVINFVSIRVNDGSILCILEGKLERIWSTFTKFHLDYFEKKKIDVTVFHWYFILK